MNAFCPRCLAWYVDKDGHECPGSEYQRRKKAESALTASRERCKALEGALRELVEAGADVMAHCGEDGPAYDAASERNHKAWDAARALLRQGEGQAGEPRT